MLTGIAVRFGIYGAVILGILWLGNAYGPNAHWRKSREAEDSARNAALEYIAQQDEIAARARDAAYELADHEFSVIYPSLDKCTLPAITASALNMVRE